jgi:hypothetical protein
VRFREEVQEVLWVATHFFSYDAINQGDKMAKAKKEGIVVLPTADVEITRDDIIAIGVAEEEKRLMLEVADCQKQVKALEKKHNDISKKLGDSLSKMAEDRFKKESTAAEKALKGLGFSDFKIKTDASPASRDKRETHVYLVVTIGSAGGQRRYGSSEFMSHEVEVRRTSEQKKMAKEMDQIKTQIDKIMDQGIESKTKLTQLPTMERQAKAALAKSILEQSREGRELISSISGMQSLPALN